MKEVFSSLYTNLFMGSVLRAALPVVLLVLGVSLIAQPVSAATTMITTNTTATTAGCTDCEVSGNPMPYYILSLPALATTTPYTIAFTTITLGGLTATASGALLIEGFSSAAASMAHGPLTITVADVTLRNGRIEVTGALPPSTALTIRNAASTGAYVWPTASEGLVVLRGLLLHSTSVFEISQSTFTVVRNADTSGTGAPITARGNVTAGGGSQLRIVSNKFNLLRTALANGQVDPLAAIDLRRNFNTFVVLSGGAVVNISANTFGAEIANADSRRVFPTSFLVLYYSMLLSGSGTLFAVDGNYARHRVAANVANVSFISRFSLLDNTVGVNAGAGTTVTAGSTLSVRRNTIDAVGYQATNDYVYCMCRVVNVQDQEMMIDGAAVHLSDNAVPTGGNAVMVFGARGLLTMRNGATVSIERNRLDNPMFRFYISSVGYSLEGMLGTNGDSTISNSNVTVRGNYFRTTIHDVMLVASMLVLQTLINAVVRVEDNTVENAAYGMLPGLDVKFQSSAIFGTKSILSIARNTAVQEPVHNLFSNSDGRGSWLRIQMPSVTFAGGSVMSVVDNAAVRKDASYWPDTDRWISTGIQIDNGGGRGTMTFTGYSMVNISNNSFQHSRQAILVMQSLTLSEGSQFLVTKNSQHSGGRNTAGISGYQFIGFHLYGDVFSLAEASRLIIADNTFFFAPAADSVEKLLGAVVTFEQKLTMSDSSVVAFERNIVSAPNTTTKYAVGVGLDPMEYIAASHAFQTAEDPTPTSLSAGVFLSGWSNLLVADNAVQMNLFTEDSWENRYIAAGINGGPTALVTKSTLVAQRNSLTIGALFTDGNDVQVTGIDIPRLLWATGASTMSVVENDIVAYSGGLSSWNTMLVCAVCPKVASGGGAFARHLRAQSAEPEDGYLQGQIRARLDNPLYPTTGADGDDGSHLLEGGSVLNVSRNRFTPHFDESSFSNGYRTALFFRLRGNVLAASGSVYGINDNVVAGHVENAPSSPTFPHPHTNQTADGVGLIQILKSSGCSGIAATVGSTISFRRNVAFLNYSTPGRLPPSETTFIVAISASYVAADNRSTIAVSDNFLHVEMLVEGSYTVTISGVRADLSVCYSGSIFMFFMARGASTLALRNNSYSLLNRDPAAVSQGMFRTSGTSFVGIDTDHDSSRGNAYVIGDESFVDLSMNQIQIRRLVVAQSSVDAAMVGMTAQKIVALSGGTINVVGNNILLDMPALDTNIDSYTRGIAICSVDYNQNNQDRLLLEDRGTLRISDNDIRMAGSLNAVGLVIGRCLQGGGLIPMARRMAAAASAQAPPLPAQFVFNPFTDSYYTAFLPYGLVVYNASAVVVTSTYIKIEGSMKAAVGAIFGAYSDRVYVEEDSSILITDTDVNATVRVVEGIIPFDRAFRAQTAVDLIQTVGILLPPQPVVRARSSIQLLASGVEFLTTPDSTGIEYTVYGISTVLQDNSGSGPACCAKAFHAQASLSAGIHIEDSSNFTVDRANLALDGFAVVGVQLAAIEDFSYVGKGSSMTITDVQLTGNMQYAQQVAGMMIDTGGIAVIDHSTIATTNNRIDISVTSQGFYAPQQILRNLRGVGLHFSYIELDGQSLAVVDSNTISVRYDRGIHSNPPFPSSSDVWQLIMLGGIDDGAFPRGALAMIPHARGMAAEAITPNNTSLQQDKQKNKRRRHHRGSKDPEDPIAAPTAGQRQRGFRATSAASAGFPQSLPDEGGDTLVVGGSIIRAASNNVLVTPTPTIHHFLLHTIVGISASLSFYSRTSRFYVTSPANGPGPGQLVLDANTIAINAGASRSLGIAFVEPTLYDGAPLVITGNTLAFVSTPTTFEMTFLGMTAPNSILLYDAASLQVLQNAFAGTAITHTFGVEVDVIYGGTPTVTINDNNITHAVDAAASTAPVREVLGIWVYAEADIENNTLSITVRRNTITAMASSASSKMEGIFLEIYNSISDSTGEALILSVTDNTVRNVPPPAGTLFVSSFFDANGGIIVKTQMDQLKPSITIARNVIDMADAEDGIVLVHSDGTNTNRHDGSTMVIQDNQARVICSDGMRCAGLSLRRLQTAEYVTTPPTAAWIKLIPLEITNAAVTITNNRIALQLQGALGPWPVIAALHLTDRNDTRLVNTQLTLEDNIVSVSGPFTMDTAATGLDVIRVTTLFMGARTLVNTNVALRRNRFLNVVQGASVSGDATMAPPSFLDLGLPRKPTWDAASVFTGGTFTLEYNTFASPQSVAISAPPSMTIVDGPLLANPALMDNHTIVAGVMASTAAPYYSTAVCNRIQSEDLFGRYDDAGYVAGLYFNATAPCEVTTTTTAATTTTTTAAETTTTTGTATMTTTTTTATGATTTAGMVSTTTAVTTTETGTTATGATAATTTDAPTTTSAVTAMTGDTTTAGTGTDPSTSAGTTESTTTATGTTTAAGATSTAAAATSTASAASTTTAAPTSTPAPTPPPTPAPTTAPARARTRTRTATLCPPIVLQGRLAVAPLLSGGRTISDAQVRRGFTLNASVAADVALRLAAGGALSLVASYASTRATPNLDGFAAALPTASLQVLSSGLALITVSALPSYTIQDEEVLQLRAAETAIAFPSCGGSALVTIATVRVEPSGSSFGAAAGGATTGVSGGAAGTAMLTGGAALAAEQQALAAFGLMPCADPHTRASFGSYRALSPVALSDSYLGVLLGNAVLLAAIAIIQAVIVLVLRLWKRVVRLEQLMAMARFPSFLLNASFAIHTGTAYASSQLVSMPGFSAGEQAAGAIGLVFVVLYPFGLVGYAYRYIGRAYQRYEMAEWLQEKKWPAWLTYLLPLGAMFAPETRRAYGSYVSSYQAPQHYWPSYPTWTPLIVALGGLFHPTTVPACQALFVSMGILFLITGGIVFHFRPRRASAANWLDTAARVLSAIILFCLAATVDPAKPDMARAAFSAVVVFGFTQTALTVVRLLYAYFMTIMDRRMAKDLVPLSTVWVHITEEGKSSTRAFAQADDVLMELTAEAGKRDTTDLAAVTLPHGERSDEDVSSDELEEIIGGGPSAAATAAVPIALPSKPLGTASDGLHTRAAPPPRDDRKRNSSSNDEQQDASSSSGLGGSSSSSSGVDIHMDDDDDL